MESKTRAGSHNERWKTAAVLIGRLIFGVVFLMAVSLKLVFVGMDATAAEIARAGFPIPVLLAWVAALFELTLAIGFLTGVYFREVAIVSAAYVLFLAFSFHGPAKFANNPMEFGFFVDHFTFVAGLLFAAANGPGGRLVLAAEKLPSNL